MDYANPERPPALVCATPYEVLVLRIAVSEKND